MRRNRFDTPTSSLMERRPTISASSSSRNGLLQRTSPFLRTRTDRSFEPRRRARETSSRELWPNQRGSPRSSTSRTEPSMRRSIGSCRRFDREASNLSSKEAVLPLLPTSPPTQLPKRPSSQPSLPPPPLPLLAPPPPPPLNIANNPPSLPSPPCLAPQEEVPLPPPTNPHPPPTLQPPPTLLLLTPSPLQPRDSSTEDRCS